MSSVELARARSVAGGVVDPELPMLTVADLGMLRGVHAEHGRVVVTLTPTFLGCPALAHLGAQITRALAESGFDDARVQLSLSPPWSSDDLTSAARRKLAAAGIAPPGETACPRCDSLRTTRLAAFGSTACRALLRCESCGEPFEAFRVVGSGARP